MLAARTLRAARRKPVITRFTSYSSYSPSRSPRRNPPTGARERFVAGAPAAARPPATAPGSAAARFAAAALAVTAATPALAYLIVGAQPTALGLVAVAYLVAAMLASAYMALAPPLAQVGWCNLVTLLRLLITSALLAPLIAPGSTAVVLALATVALLLDGVDGWLARRFGQASDFGARFDMEVDAALGLVLALNAWAAGTVGPLVLLLGLPRYGFSAAALVWPWIDRPLPERIGRKAVCVLQIAVLIALQLPLLAGAPASILLGIALLALAWSFGRDLLWLRFASA